MSPGIYSSPTNQSATFENKNLKIWKFENWKSENGHQERVHRQLSSLRPLSLYGHHAAHFDWGEVLSIALHNVYFVKYDVTVSFLAQVLDTVAYFVSHVLDSGYSDIFWHIL